MIPQIQIIHSNRILEKAFKEVIHKGITLLREMKISIMVWALVRKSGAV